jgi:hypothetical protein
MRILYLLVFLLFGCAYVPHYTTCEPSYIIPIYGSKYCGSEPVDSDMSLYFLAFERVWASDKSRTQKPATLRAALSSVRIYWQNEVFTYPGGNSRLLGLTYQADKKGIRMYVYVPPSCTDLSCTALGHEMLHVAYGTLDNDMHLEHMNNSAQWPAFQEQFIRKVNKEYLRMKLKK